MTKENEFHISWLISCLEEWDMTFDDETEIPDLIESIKEKKGLTPEKLEFLVFHLWQMAHGSLLTMDWGDTV